jgi:putative oxidoreductase
MSATERVGSLVARLALAGIFVVSGFAKIAGPAGTATYIASHGLPAPTALALLAGIVELAGGLLIATGFRTRTAALVLAAYLVPVTAVFHNPAGLTGMEAMMQQIQLMKNLSIIGGLLVVATSGARGLSLDAYRRKARGVGSEPRSAERAHA